MRPLIVASVLTAALLVAAAMPAAAETTPTPDGNVIKINIAVDVFAGKNARTGPDGTPIDEYFKTVVKNTWGAAFDKLPYKSCFKLELALDIKLYDINAKGRRAATRSTSAPRPGGGRASAGTASPKRRAATATPATAHARSRTTARGTSR